MSNGAGSRISSAIRQSPRWWQWPTVLSLDAPVVAVLWQWELARTAGIALRSPRPFVLAASVWLAYAADRWIEGWRLDPKQVRTQRHRFYQRWRWPVALVWLAVFAGDLTAALAGLTAREVAAGLALLAAVLAYLLSHQLIHRRNPWRAPKEICVALLLGGGAVLFPALAPGAEWAPMAVPLSLFLLLSFANCALISVWEGAIDESHGQTSLALQFRRGALFSHWLPWTLAAVAAVLCISGKGPVRPAAICALVSALLLGLLDRAEPRLGWRAARVLADVALMTPAAHLAAVLLRLS